MLLNRTCRRSNHEDRTRLNISFKETSPNFKSEYGNPQHIVKRPVSSVQFEVFNEEFVRGIVGRTSRKGIDGYLGIEVTELTAGTLVAQFDARAELITAMGNMHGDCLSALIDHCLGVIMYPLMPPGYWAATTEFKVNLLTPLQVGCALPPRRFAP